MPILLAQLIHDFGTGALLLGPVLHTLKNVNNSWELPSLYVFVSGAVLVAIGWLIRHLASSFTAPDE
jgi:hypothetical protein